jgi:2-methylisocitrate lyase-like PEP mutase family enzyme
MSELAARFLSMHEKGAGFVLPNAWDAGTARILAGLGFAAVATTSAGIAFSHGRRDGALDDLEMLDAVDQFVSAVDCPVSADLESGYADVGETFRAAVELGVVGANLEDARPDGGGLYDAEAATERVATARVAAPSGTFVLNARTDTYLQRVEDAFGETIRRAQLYLEAGADCIFVPGVADADTIRSLCDEIDAPVNIVSGLSDTVLDAPTLRSLGVARISVGGSLARAALAYVERAGREMLDAGTFGFTADAIPHADLQRRFGRS